MVEQESETSVSIALGQAEAAPEQAAAVRSAGMSAETFAEHERWTAEKAESQAADIRKRWGGSDEGVERGLRSAGYAAERLGISTEDQGAFAQLRSQGEGLTTLAHLGEALRHIPEDITPADAKVRIDEFKTDASFRERLFSGDIAAKKVWEGLKAVAFHSR